MKILNKPVFMLKDCVEGGEYQDRIIDAFHKEGKAQGFDKRDLKKVVRLARKQNEYNGFVEVFKNNVKYA